MKTSKTLWIKRLVIGAAVSALPQVLLARGPDNFPSPYLPPLPHLQHSPDFAERGGPAPPAHGPGPEAPGMLHGQPLLNDIDLSEAQQDAVFELVHAQIPGQRALEKKAAKAFDELQRLGTGEPFNAKQARALADDYAQAQARLAFNQAELGSKLRAQLTPEQRVQLDTPRPAHPRQAKP